MLSLRAFVDVPYSGPEALGRWWPVAPTGPGDRLFLDGAATEAQAGLFVALIATDRLTEPLPTRQVVVDELLAHEWLGTSGGLLLADSATGVTIEPGCCCGVEDWWHWQNAFDDPSQVSLGHDPGPVVERHRDAIRVWQDGGPPLDLGHGIGAYVDLSVAELVALLRGVQRDLIGFRAVLDRWVWATGLGGRGEALVRTLDEQLRLSTPLDLPAGS
jgi:hypothetical protein